MVRSRWLWRGVLVGCLGLWAYVMVVVGLLAALEWPSRFEPLGRLCLVFGAGLVALGEFLLAMLASRLFPRANPIMTGIGELVPWAALVLVLAGVLLWK